MDSSTSVFLFTTWSDGAHCCRTIYSALVDSSGFRLKDTVFLCDGYYGYRHLDSSGIPLIVANIDFFPYSWTSFSGTEFNVAVFAITKTGLQNVTARYPKLVKRDMRGFRKSIRACKQAITQTEIAEDLETNQMEEMGPQWIGELKQELACLLISYRSLHRESEGWAEIERQYTFKGRQRFLRALKKLLPEHLKRYGSQFE